MQNAVMDAFFEKWTLDTLAWFEEKRTEYRTNYKGFMTKYRIMSGFPLISKATYELIRSHPLRDRVGCGRSIEGIIRQDMADKKAKVYAKVTAKVGEIIEVALHTGDDGTPNGRVTGTKGAVYISTIVAGGYNIQCLHYRVLVK